MDVDESNPNNFTKDIKHYAIGFSDYFGFILSILKNKYFNVA
jgi:hypothetical protein